MAIGDFDFLKRDKNPLKYRDHLIGSLGYMAKELVLGDPYGRPADYYSLAVLLYELHTGKLPFETEEKVYDRNRVFPQIADPCLNKWLLKLAIDDPNERFLQNFGSSASQGSGLSSYCLVS